MKKKNHPLHGHGYGGANLDNVQIITLKEVDSTNNFLRSLAADEVKNEIVVAVAKNQTAGRGQRGNSWESEEGKNLTFSILIQPVFLEARQQFILSQAIALSIKEVLYDYVRSPHPRIKCLAVQYLHLGANLQPLGRFRGWGTTPGIGSSF